MNNQEHISLLVKKLLDDSLSLEELRELQKFFAPKKISDEVDSWLTDIWQSSESGERLSVDSKEILDKLGRKIRNSAQRNSSGNIGNNRVYRTMRSFARYAAVFLIAMLLSWFIFRNNESGEKVYPADNADVTGINEISVTYGSKTKIVLPDNSVVYLNSGSRLSYPSVFGQERHVDLTGEGYFVVKSDSIHPFFVHSSGISVRALGTEFNVKAYPEEEQVETFLVSGTVEIMKANDRKRSIVELKPGEKASYIKANNLKQSVSKQVKEQPKMIVYSETKPDVSAGWVTNQLVFDAETFEQIAVRLERWYNVEIDILGGNLKKARLSGRYDTENIEQVLHSLHMTTQFTYQIEKNKITIK